MSNESSEEIFAEMRKMPLDVFIDANANPVFKSYADRLEAAKRREDEKHSEEVQSLQGTIVKLNDAIAEKQELNENSKSAKIEFCNAAAVREACVKALEELEQVHKCNDARLHFADIVHVGNAKRELQEAIKKPPRNCDMYGGDYKMLHTAWFDWTGTPDGHNDDGTVKLTFGEWLLVMARKGVRK